MEQYTIVRRYPGQQSQPCEPVMTNKTAAWLSLAILIEDYEAHGYTAMQFPSNPRLFIMADDVESFQLEMMVSEVPDPRATMFLDFGISSEDDTEPVMSIGVM